MSANRHCANCGVDLEYLRATGISSVYFPGGFDIELCEPCWLEEDALIDESGNNLPDRLAHYKHMIARLGMSDEAENYERGYTGHGRGVVVTNDGHGNFSERPMTVAELAARAPAWAIGADPYDFMNQAVFAYIRSWEVIAAAIEAALAEQAAKHDRRVTDLLEANTREVERRREAEAEAGRLRAILDKVDPRRRSGVSDQIVALLWTAAAHGMEGKDIRRWLLDENPNWNRRSINNALDYLKRAGKIDRDAAGVYALSAGTADA